AIPEEADRHVRPRKPPPALQLASVPLSRVSGRGWREAPGEGRRQASRRHHRDRPEGAGTRKSGPIAVTPEVLGEPLHPVSSRASVEGPGWPGAVSPPIFCRTLPPGSLD